LTILQLRYPDNKEKYIGSEENWNKAEQAIIDATKEVNFETTTAYGEAAFYGPKLDFMVKDALGRSWQLGTIQVDYNLPERFQLEYIGSDNAKHRPVMIHRAPFGSMERFIGVLTEHCAGKFPFWLSPDQFAILPVSDKYLDYSKTLLAELTAAGFRGEIDDRVESIGKKIRDSELKKIPYMLIIGEKEVENQNVSVRKQGSGDQGTESLTSFIDHLKSLL
jgi:threonyl-tRNA synthetase